MAKQIKGSKIEFKHHNKAEGIYWNPSCAAFTRKIENRLLTSMKEGNRFR